MLYGSQNRLLYILRDADLQSTSDQAMLRLGFFTKYMLTHGIAVRKTGAASVACLGGIYDAAAKGGNALVAAAQSWVTLASGVNVPLTFAIAGLTTQPGRDLFLALSTGSTAACTGDVFLFGNVLD